MCQPFVRGIPLVLLLASLTCLTCLSATAVSQETPEAAAAADAPDPAAAFAAKLEQWKTILKELRGLGPKFATASDAEADQIRQQWDQLIAQGEQLLPELRDTGVKAYAAAPAANRELERFLIKLLEDDLKHDRYDAAFALAKSLIDGGCGFKQVYNAAGIAAFVTNDFDNAEAYLQEAADAGVISDQGRQYQSLLPQYKQFWEEEKKLRETETELPQVKVTTNRGELVIDLFENQAPGAVGNFISLVEDGFYDGLTFHRVLPGFMAQGGCPEGTGRGGPGYSIYCECYEPNHRKHFRGTLSMAHSGRDTGGSQFFLTFVPTAHLNGRHTAFGRVVQGMDVLEKITRRDPDSTDPQPPPDTILKMEVLRKTEGRDYQPNKVQ